LIGAGLSVAWSAMLNSNFLVVSTAIYLIAGAVGRSALKSRTAGISSLQLFGSSR
jgi:hypothetical protein